MVSEIDCLVLGSNVHELDPVLRWIKDKGIQTKCIAVQIPKIFEAHTECLEIEESLLSPITNEAVTTTK